MAKIIKVGSQNPTFTSQNSNPAKTSRAGNITNPFKFTNFEGNTLQFADVFEGFDSKKSNNISFKGANKLKMVASSVTGSMNRMRSGISESITNFVNRVRGAWDYAKNTNVSDLGAVKAFNNLALVKAFNDVMNTEIKLPTIDMSGINNSISNIKNGLGEKWTAMISRIQSNGHIVPKDASVKTIEELWKNEIALQEAREVA